jgi:hypothetical protein
MLQNENKRRQWTAWDLARDILKRRIRLAREPQDHRGDYAYNSKQDIS